MNGQAPREVTITRIFDAPRELVFKAWTKPELVKQWFGPNEFTIPTAEMDVRPEGEFLIVMRGPDGQDYPSKGIYHEIVEPERIVFTDSAFEDEAGRPLLAVHNTVTFSELGGKTKMVLHCVVIRVTPEMEEALMGMEQGWSESFDKMEKLLVRA